MKKDYSDLLKLIRLLKARAFILESKYSDLSLDKIKVYELEKDIDAVERLSSAISFKADNIVGEMMDKYIDEYYEQESIERYNCGKCINIKKRDVPFIVLEKIDRFNVNEIFSDRVIE